MKTGKTGLNRDFTVTTLGCKLNQYESECVRQDLVRRGWKYNEFDKGASFVIINTCTVTGKTDSRCRNAIRRARRISPGAIVLVTGCYAETEPSLLESMEETDVIVGNRAKGSIADLMEQIYKSGCADLSLQFSQDNRLPDIDDFLDHSRAFIKVQEGCDSSCSYCIIPRARGGSRSVDSEDVLDQVHRLEDNGCEEIVLTGIHIGRYGKDIASGVDLELLLSRILKETGRIRIRLSSIEMNEVTGGIIELAASSPRVASHLHIPLQSGDDEILAAMNRPYSTMLFRNKIDEVKKASEDISIGTDIIVGFPGETDSHFRNTYNFLDDLRVDYFHVFSFSRRPQTPAFDMIDQVSPDKKKSRSRKLISLGKKKKREFMRNRAGKRELALIQGKERRYSRFSTGVTGSYCEISLKAPSSMNGKLAEVEITHYSRGRLYGRLVKSPVLAKEL